MRRSSNAWSRSVLVPLVTTLVLIAIVGYGVTIPLIRHALMKQKRACVRSLTESAWTVLDRFGTCVKEGELTAEQARRHAADVVRSMRYGPNELAYYWISDVNCALIAHSHRRELEGQDVGALQDPSGVHLFREFAEVARTSGAGFVEYQWQWNNDPSRIGAKLSYVKVYEPWGWIVGTGVYIDDVQREIAGITGKLNLAYAGLLVVAGTFSVLVFRHSRRVERLRREVERSSYWHLGAMRSVANGIVITDPDGDITWVNPAFSRLTGYSPAEAIGQNPRMLKSGGHDDEYYSEMWQTISAGKVWHGEVINRRKDGSLYTEEMTITPVTDDTGAIAHYVAIKQDVTARRASEEALLAAKDAADAANRAKSDFLARMSHELRTPLNSIIGFTDLMISDQRDPPTDKRARRLEKVHRNSKHLLALINDILDLSKIEAGRMELVDSEVDITTLLEETADVVRPLLKPGVSLEVCIDELLGQRPGWQGDGMRLRQVIANLLSNAAKFTEQGQVTLRGLVRGERLSIEVEDSGIGITADDLLRIFDDFQQVDTSHSRRAGGTGLGLSICRKLCRLMGGDVTVRSSPGVGSCFIVGLPYSVVSKAPQTRINDQPLIANSAGS